MSASNIISFGSGILCGKFFGIVPSVVILGFTMMVTQPTIYIDMYNGLSSLNAEVLAEGIKNITEIAISR